MPHDAKGEEEYGEVAGGRLCPRQGCRGLCSTGVEGAAPAPVAPKAPGAPAPSGAPKPAETPKPPVA